MALSDLTSYPPPSRRLRLGMVGGGRGALVGHWHWIGARISNRWDLVAGALSADPEVAKASGRDWLLAEDRIYTDFNEMARAEAARSDGIEAVAICTPNVSHRAIAESFMKHGIDIICDKPMTMTPKDSNALIALQAQTGLVFAITHPYTYHPMARQARQMVARGDVGTIRQCLVEYAQDWATGPEDPNSKPQSWRRDPAKIGRASATGDIGTHCLHMIEFVTGLRVNKLRADFHICGAPKNMEDTAFLSLRFENGAPGSMWLSQAAPGNACGLTFRIFGDKGALYWDQENPEVLRFTPLNQPEQRLIRGHGAGVVPEVERMLRLPRGHGEALSDAWGNLYTEIAIAVEARRLGKNIPPGFLALADVQEGARGVRFIHAAADSHEAGGIWTELS